jgi:hypothetical protein
MSNLEIEIRTSLCNKNQDKCNISNQLAYPDTTTNVIVTII